MRRKDVVSQNEMESTEHNHWICCAQRDELFSPDEQTCGITRTWEGLGIDWLCGNLGQFGPGDKAILFEFQRRTVNVAEVLEVGPRGPKHDYRYLVAYRPVEGFPKPLSLDLVLMLKSKGLIKYLHDLRGDHRITPESYHKLKEALLEWKADRRARGGIHT